MDAEVRESPTCKNCGTPLPGEFCPNCGQRDYDFNRSFREIASELAESFWNWDTKLIRGVFDLLFRPGKLTAEYLAGRRMSQVPPLRFYLFVSILFFLAGSLSPSDVVRFNETEANVKLEDLPLDPETLARAKAAKEAIAAENRATPGSTEARITDFFQDRMSRREEIQRLARDYFPNLVFALLPVFALITWAVFRRAKLGYLSHLVMALHLHSFFFLFVLVERGWAGLIALVSTQASAIVRLAGVCYLVYYTIVAARRVFGCPLWGTIWRAVLVNLLYLAALGVGSVVFMVVVLLLA